MGGISVFACQWQNGTVKRSLCALSDILGGYIGRFTWCHTDISLYFPIDSWLFWMGSHWPLWKAKSSLWALAVSNGGGYIVRFTWCHTDISLYLPISWLFQMGSHWIHWKAKSSLCALEVLNGGNNCQIDLVSHWHFLISSYKLTVSNGLSLTTLKSKEFTLCSGSF